jgi:hypothetical protein
LLGDTVKVIKGVGMKEIGCNCFAKKKKKKKDDVKVWDNVINYNFLDE